jgi:hypothetical protein
VRFPLPFRHRRRASRRRRALGPPACRPQVPDRPGAGKKGGRDAAGRCARTPRTLVPTDRRLVWSCRTPHLLRSRMRTAHRTPGRRLVLHLLGYCSATLIVVATMPVAHAGEPGDGGAVSSAETAVAVEAPADPQRGFVSRVGASRRCAVGRVRVLLAGTAARRAVRLPWLRARPTCPSLSSARTRARAPLGAQVPGSRCGRHSRTERRGAAYSRGSMCHRSGPCRRRWFFRTN